MIFYTEEVRYDVPASGQCAGYYWKSRWKIVIGDGIFEDVKIYKETIKDYDLIWREEDIYQVSGRFGYLRIPKELISGIAKIFNRYEKVKALK